MENFTEDVTSALYDILGLAKPGLQSCRMFCDGLLHNDDFVAVGQEGLKLAKRGYEELTLEWARKAVESDGQGEAKVRLVVPVGRAIKSFINQEEIFTTSERLRKEGGLLPGSPIRVFRITYFREKH